MSASAFQEYLSKIEANYKDAVIDLLGRVCAVSVKTIEIVKEMAE